MLSKLIEKYLKMNSPSVELLPICHTTDLQILRERIIQAKELRAINPCSYYNDQKILFFAYGKSSYFPSALQIDSYFIGNPPISIIYNKEFLNRIEINRMVCFDSGGYIKGMYDYDLNLPQSSKTTKVEKIELLKFFTIENPSSSHIQAAIEILYNTNENYLLDDLKLYFDIEEHQLSVSLNQMNKIKLLKSQGLSGFGPQAFTFEFQLIEKNIPLIPDAITVPLSRISSLFAINYWKDYFPESELLIYEISEYPGANYGNMRNKVKDYCSA